MRTNYKFQLFSREGDVDYGPNGVVLNGFSQDVMDIANPWERSYKYIYKRLMRGYKLDQEHQALSVQVVVNHATEGFI